MQCQWCLLLIMLGGTSGGLAGCAVWHDSPEYSLGFYNDTANQIDDSRVDWRVNHIAHFDGGGVLVSEGEAVSHQDPRPIPAEVTVTWKTADGKAHSQRAAVAKLIRDPAKFSGTIYFKFTADGKVEVIPITYEEQDRVAAQGKSAIRESR